MPDKVKQALARTALKVSEDGDRFKFNTSVAALMILVNELESVETVSKSALTQLVIMLAPFAPHLSEHLWERLGGEGSVHQQSWHTASVTVASESEVVIQVGGRRRGSIRISPSAEEAEVVTEALKITAVFNALAGEQPKRVIYIPGKIINLVV